MRIQTLIRGAAYTLLLAIAACGSSGGGDDDSSPNQLVRLEDEPAGGNCFHGGVVLMTGADDNGNGLLDDGEVDSTVYVCDGAGAHSTLIDVAEEPAGEFCPEGGLALHTGVDVNDDGTLQPDEITSTEYVCNGRPGSGLNSLVAIVVEPPGENCEAGGQSIQSGMDDSGDGVLQPDEVDSTVYVCNGAGVAALVRLADEAAGVNCEHGGQAMMTGMDLDADGYLDDEEVTTTAYICNGDQGETGPASAFDVTDVPASELCPTGGVRIATGIDSNGNGDLDPEEVTASEIVCHGEMGPSAPRPLVEVSDEPAGENCALGGQRIDAGVDVNGNGSLEAMEIDSTDYVCDAGGEGALVNVTEVPAGEECAAGGLRVDTGLDDDGDGRLDVGEVDGTEFVCNAVSASTLVRASRAAWGGVCPRGGVIVETGMDEDGDGELDDAEVDEEQYICNLYFVQISGGFNHTCALASDGRLRCWGRNNYGQLGDGTDTRRLTPVLVEGLEGVASVECGDMHTCAVQTDGDVYCWGYNNYGQLGDGTRVNRWRSVHVSTIEGVAEISAGQNHTCARLRTGQVRCWGYNGYGQIGDATTSDRYLPAVVHGVSDAQSVAAGGNHTCIATEEARVRCWGYNGYGQLGDATSTSRQSPVMVGVIDDASEVTAGQNHTCALLTDGRGRCWGYNGQGNLGDASHTGRLSPVLINGLSTMTSITAGYEFTCAILEDETARCWGYNGYGGLGDSTSSGRNVPVEVLDEDDALDMSGGQYHTCAVRNDGRALCWGYNGYGQLGDDTVETTYTASAVHMDDTL